MSYVTFGPGGVLGILRPDSKKRTTRTTPSIIDGVDETGVTEVVSVQSTACDRDVELPATEVSDRVLADAAAVGDRQAFETLVLRYGPALHRYARRMLRDEGDVAEVVQDTFVAAWRQLKSFRAESSLQTWLFAICSHKIVDSRRVKRAQPIDDRMLEPLAGPSASVDPFTSASNSEFISALEMALAELPPRQRASWVLREIESMTFTDIGEVLALSPNAVRGHHQRARATLSERLRRWR